MESEIQVIRNNSNSDCTPSAVWVDGNGRLFVGPTAYKRLEVDSGNAFAEFKLQMGTDTNYKFQKSGRQMRPEELSAEILKSLKDDVHRAKSEDMQAAVITVPAAFELPQTQSTNKAAQLAGLSQIVLLQEPVAAAMAYGFQSKSDKVFWLVYDFGGGNIRCRCGLHSRRSDPSGQSRRRQSSRRQADRLGNRDTIARSCSIEQTQTHRLSPRQSEDGSVPLQS